MLPLLVCALAALPSHVDDGAEVLTQTQASVLLEPELAVLEDRQGVVAFLVTREELDPREPSEALAQRVAREAGATGKWFAVIYYARSNYLHVTGYQPNYPLPRERLAPVLQATLATNPDTGAALVEVMKVASREASHTFTGARLRWWKDQSLGFLATLFAGLLFFAGVAWRLWWEARVRARVWRGARAMREEWDEEEAAHGRRSAERKFGQRPELDDTDEELRRKARLRR